MKRVTAVFLSLFIAFAAYAQNDTIPVPEVIPDTEELNDDLEDLDDNLQEMEKELEEMEEQEEIFKTPEKTEVSIGKNEVFIVEGNGDTTKVKLGGKGISIVEGEDGTSINIIDMEENKTSNKKKKQKKFKPHYAGFEIGLNNYLTADNKFLNQGFMNLNTGKSWNYNINFIEYGFGLGTSYAGLVTGMGFEITNYVFDGTGTISKDLDGNIVSVPDPFDNVSKSSFNMTYLTAPLLLEFQIPAGKHRIHISGGVVGGIKLSSKTKVKYALNGDRLKSKLPGDYSLSPLRYGFTARIGYRAINIFANYYMTPLFGETDTPVLHPVSIGLNIIPF